MRSVAERTNYAKAVIAEKLTFFRKAEPSELTGWSYRAVRID